MKTILLSLIMALTFTLSAEPATYPATYSDASALEYVAPGVLLAQAEEPTGITADEIAQIIEEKVQPLIDETVKQLEAAPAPGSPAQSWIFWAMSAAMAFIGVITGVFFSGNKRNLKLD